MIKGLSFAWVLFIFEIHWNKKWNSDFSAHSTFTTTGVFLFFFGGNIYIAVIQYFLKQQVLLQIPPHALYKWALKWSIWTQTQSNKHVSSKDCVQFILCWLISLSRYPNLAVIQLNKFLLKMKQMFSIIILRKAEMKWWMFLVGYYSDYMGPEIIIYFRIFQKQWFSSGIPNIKQIKQITPLTMIYLWYTISTFLRAKFNNISSAVPS